MTQLCHKTRQRSNLAFNRSDLPGPGVCPHTVRMLRTNYGGQMKFHLPILGRYAKRMKNERGRQTLLGNPVYRNWRWIEGVDGATYSLNEIQIETYIFANADQIDNARVIESMQVD